MGDSSLLARLDQLEKGEVLAYDIPLCPFTVDELSDYLSFKLSVVGYQGAELFDYDVVENIWRDTRGIPASVNQIAAGLLLNKALNKDDERRLGLPMVYMGLLVLLLAALIMAIFYVGDSPESSNDELVSSDPIAAPLESVSEVDQESPSIADTVLPVDQAEPVDESVPPTKEVSDSDALSQVGEAAESPVLIEGGESLVGSLDSDAAAKIAVDSVADEAKLAIPPLENEVISSQSAVNSSAPALGDSESSASLSGDVPLSSESPVQEKVAALLTTDEQAVMFWPEEAYTLQVMAAGQLVGVEAFVAKQENRNLLRIVRLSRNGSPWYTVVVGIYDDIPLARQAIAGLPDAQKRAKPWPRKIGDLQRSIEDFRRR